jgi:hypothetical protein
MEKLHFCEEEVISFLENKIMEETANQKEQNLYQNYLWFGKLHKFNRTYRSLVEQMRELFKIKY